MNGSASTKVARPRFDNIDALRGLALAGMLIVHFQYYVTDAGLWSLRVNSAIDYLAVERFYPLFSLLFGAGFAIQFERWSEREGFVAMYLRRLGALMGFGIALIATTGYTVLESYAFWGLVVLAVRKWSNRAIAMLVLVCALSGPLLQVGLWEWESRKYSPEQSNYIVTDAAKAQRQYLDEADRLQDSRAWGELMKLRLTHSFKPYLKWQTYVPFAPLMMMLIGLLAVRFRIFQEAWDHQKLLRWLVVFGVIGLAAVLTIDFLPWFATSSLRLRAAIGRFEFAFFGQAHALAYGSLLLLWISSAAETPWFARALASMGRLSLTNYVLQLVILETFFATSTPLIRLDRWRSLVGWVVVLVLQVLFSRWWMARYRYGPLEWLWRSITLMHWQPLQRVQTRTTTA